MKSFADITKRLNRLAETLGELKERVREAVAGELSRAVAQTLQDVVHSFVRGRRDSSPPAEAAEERRPPPAEWPDDDPWAEEHRVPIEPVFDPFPRPVPAERWRRALDLGTTVLRWWLAGRWKPLLGLGVAGLAGTAAWWGGPAVHAGAGIVLTAAELLAFGTTHPHH